MGNNNTRIFILYLIILLFVYSPVFTVNYILLDDYFFLHNILFNNVAVAFKNHQNLFFVIGRPIQGLLTYIGFSLFDSINALKYLRLPTLIAYSYFALQVYKELKSRDWSIYLAFWAPLAIITLPPFQVYASWTQYFPIPIAIIIAFISGRIVWECSTLSKLLVGVLMSCISMLIYQPAAMMFWLYPVISIMGNKPFIQKETFKKMICGGAVIALSSFANISFQKLYGLLLGSHQLDKRAQFIADPFEKMSWFLRYPLQDALNFWNLQPLHFAEVVVGSIICFGLMLEVGKDLQHRIAKLITMTIIVLLTFLPNLAIKLNWAGYRTQSALTTIVLMILIFTIRNFVLHSSGEIINRPVVNKVKIALLTLSAFLFCVVSYLSVLNGFAMPQLAEANILRSYLKNNMNNEIATICVDKANWNDSLVDTVRYDEYGYPSIATPWTGVPMIMCLLKEQGWEKDEMPKVISAEKCSSDLIKSPNTLKILASDLLSSQGKNHKFKLDAMSGILWKN